MQTNKGVYGELLIEMEDNVYIVETMIGYFLSLFFCVQN